MKRIFLIITVLAGLNSPAFAQKKSTFKAKPAVASASASVLKGKSIYAQYCLSCHQADGGGVDGLNPNDPNLTMEQRLKLRRMQELKK